MMGSSLVYEDCFSCILSDKGTRSSVFLLHDESFVQYKLWRCPTLEYLTLGSMLTLVKDLLYVLRGIIFSDRKAATKCVYQLDMKTMFSLLEDLFCVNTMMSPIIWFSKLTSCQKWMIKSSSLITSSRAGVLLCVSCDVMLFRELMGSGALGYRKGLLHGHF